MAYKNLFIDLDDTLWDTFHNNKECLEEFYADYQMDRHYASFEAFYDHYMPYNLSLWAKYRAGEIDRHDLEVDRLLHVLRPMGIDDRQRAFAMNNDFLQRTTTKSRVVPGAVELLEYLRPNYRLFILSNGFREVQYKKLSSAGLDRYFTPEQLILSEDAQVQKPHKGIFDYALNKAQARLEESLMIGDCWEADIVGAYQAGMDQIWLNPEGATAEGFTPTYTVRSLEEIKQIL